MYFIWRNYSPKLQLETHVILYWTIAEQTNFSLDLSVHSIFFCRASSQLTKFPPLLLHHIHSMCHRFISNNECWMKTWNQNSGVSLLCQNQDSTHKTTWFWISEVTLRIDFCRHICLFFCYNSVYFFTHCPNVTYLVLPCHLLTKIKPQVHWYGPWVLFWCDR